MSDIVYVFLWFISLSMVISRSVNIAASGDILFFMAE